jgi:hypothetical protein
MRIVCAGLSELKTDPTHDRIHPSVLVKAVRHPGYFIFNIDKYIFLQENLDSGSSASVKSGIIVAQFHQPVPFSSVISMLAKRTP